MRLGQRLAVTIRDIAEQAGVSLTTVGIALGRPGRISDATREKVLALADELGYRPNRLVHGIQTGRSMTVGFLARVDSPFNGQMFTGAHDVLADADYAPMVMSTTPKLNELSRLHALIDRRVDGILIVPFFEAMWDEHLNELISRDIPVVSLDVEVQGRANNIDFVGTDDRGAGRAAAEHLLGLGHRSALLVTSGTPQQPPFLRCEGFEQAFAESGGVCQTISVPWISSQEVCDRACGVLGQTERPTCVFLTTDLFADRVYEAASRLGLRVPDDLSVVGFSGHVVGGYLSPALTSFRQDAFQIGRRGAELLVERMSGRVGDERRREEFPAELIERGSTGPAPA
ncbi:MAG: LacI family DNA-binding transcriptional regulator [Planctomycetota bacterium]